LGGKAENNGYILQEFGSSRVKGIFIALAIPV
jgi:hypothetical protein